MRKRIIIVVVILAVLAAVLANPASAQTTAQPESEQFVTIGFGARYADYQFTVPDGSLYCTATASFTKKTDAVGHVRHVVKLSMYGLECTAMGMRVDYGQGYGPMLLPNRNGVIKVVTPASRPFVRVWHRVGSTHTDSQESFDVIVVRRRAVT